MEATGSDVFDWFGPLAVPGSWVVLLGPLVAPGSSG